MADVANAGDEGDLWAETMWQADLHIRPATLSRPPTRLVWLVLLVCVSRWQGCQLPHVVIFESQLPCMPAHRQA